MKFRQRTYYLILSLILLVFVQNSFALIPSRQAKFITFSNVNATEMTINVTRGNGTNAIWLVREGSAPNVSGLGDDTNPTGWSANTVFGSGTNIGGSNSYLVHNGTATSVTVTGLTANTTYYVMVLEYNVDGSNYDINTNTATLNPRSKTTLQQQLGTPSGLSVGCITGTTATVNWTNDGNNAVGYYIDVRLASGAILPAYDLLDIGLPTTKTFFVSGLNNNTNYEYRLRPYDAQGRVGAATNWVSFTTQTTDPTPVITGTTPVCPSSFSVTATWTTSGWSGAPGVANWTMLSYPSGAGYTFGSLTTSSGGANSINVNTPGTYVVEAEIVCGEYASSNTYQVVVTDPAANITNNDNYACGLTYETATGTTNCGTGTWSWTGPGSVSFSPDNTAGEVTVTNTTYGAGTLYWTVIDGSVTSSDYMQLTFLPDPIATYNGTATFDVCGLTYGSLQGNDPNDYLATGSWYQVGGTGTANFSNSTAYNSNVSVNQYGSYTFRWELQNSCVSDEEDIYVTFWEQPSTSTVYTADFSQCLGTQSYGTLSANTPSVGSGSWTASGGTASFSSTTTPTPTVWPTVTGDYGEFTFNWTISNGPVCSPSTDYVVATFYNTPTISAIAGTDTYICATTTYQLNGNNPYSYTGVWTQIDGPETATFSNPTLYNTTVTVQDICSECCSAQYTFRWSIINGTCTSYDDVALTFLPPTPTATIYNTNLSVCGALTYDLEAEGAWCGEGTWTSTPTGATFEDVNSENVSVTIPSFSGDYVEYTFNWTISGLCGTNNDNITVTFYNEPTTADAGTDTYYCGTLTGTMAANAPIVGSGSWTTTSTGVVFNNASNPTTTFTVPTYGEYTFAWTISNGTCDPSTDNVVITYYQIYTANAGTDDNICGLTYQLNGNNVSSPSTVSWSLLSGPGTASFSNTSINNPIVNTSTYGTYTFQYSITNGPCGTSNDLVEISFFEPIDVVNNGSSNPNACINQAYTGLNLGTPTCGSGSWTLITFPTGGSASFGNSTDPNTDVTFSGATGSYIIRYDHTCGPCTDYVDIPFNVTNSIYVPPTTISGDNLPVAGTSNVQYSVPNYDNNLTYNWSYSCTTTGSTPTLHTNNHLLTIDYPLDACDGTLTVNIIDLCGNTSTATMSIDVQQYPVITGATLNQNNTYIDVTFNAGVYTNNVSPLQPVNMSDFQLIFQKNGGTATNVTVTSMTKTDGSALTGGESTVRFNLNVTGTPNGCETIEIKPFANQVYNGIGSLAMPATQTTGIKNLFNKQEPTVDASNLNTTNVYAVQATLNWTNGNGQKRLVVMKQGSAPTGPTDYVTYNANTAFGSGATTGAGSFVVYNGTGNSVTVTNLNPNTQYYFGVYEYNDACNVSPNYQNSAISSFTTANAATKLVITSNPTKILSGVGFNITIQAQDASNNPAYTTCNETITVSVTGSGTLSGTTSATFPTNVTSININGIVYTNNSGECGVIFTVDDAGCGIDLTQHNFNVNVAPGIPPGQATGITGTVTSTTITINWNNPSSPGNGRVVFVRQASVTSLSSIIDGDNYDIASTSSPVNFSSLPGSPTDTRPFFRTSAGNSVQLTNLSPNTIYNFRVVEYNRVACGSDALYRFRKTNFSSLNPRNLQTSSSKLGFNGVEIAYFDGKSYQLSVDLNWEAISENGLMGYEVYRIQDIEDAHEVYVGNVGVKATAGNNNKYNLVDNQNIQLGESYLYRLVGVDVNGQKVDLAESYVTITDLPSNVFNLTIGEITPNPVKDVVRFDILTTKQLPVLIQVFNADGKVVYSEQRNVNGTSNVEFKLNNAAAGSYYIMVTGGEEVSVGSFIYQP